MPRKTRKEKLAASLHKQRINVTTSDNETKEKKQIIKPNITASPQSKVKSEPLTTANKDFFNDHVRDYFLQDLRKSIVVITAILLLELTLFLANQAGLLNFINF